MAAFADFYAFSPWMWFSLLVNIAATAAENTTYMFEDANFTGLYNSTTPTFDSTTPTFGYSTTESTASPPPTTLLSPDPLPLSGRLPSPVTDVVRLCACDEQKGICDINCCCDKDCTDEVRLFTKCSIDNVSGNKKLCSQRAVQYSLGSTKEGFSELRTSVQTETGDGIFCILTQNGVDGLSFVPPDVPSARNFDSLLEQFLAYPLNPLNAGISSATVSAAGQQASPGYLYGDVMAAATGNGQRDPFNLPAPGVGTYCVDRNPAAFLIKQSSRCSRRLVDDKDCTMLPGLNMYTYTGVQLLGNQRTQHSTKVAVVTASASLEVNVNYESRIIKETDGLCKIILVIVEVSSVVQQSLEGTQTLVSLTGEEKLNPVILSPGVCSNIVLQVAYVVKYSSAGEVVNLTASLVLGTVRRDTLLLEQEFLINFVQVGVKEVAVTYSGNPGYVPGLPLVSGTKTADGIAQITDARGGLTILRSAMQQDCLRGPHQRSSVLFGLDMSSGCMLRLEETANCSLVSQVLLDILKGQNRPQYVGAFGTSPVNSPLDWVSIMNHSKAVDGQSCSIPLSYCLEVEWTKYGSLVNPQAQIVSIKEVIHTNTSTLALISGGSGVIAVTSSVSFVSVSAAARPGYRASPTIDAKLPFDFFFPFV